MTVYKQFTDDAVERLMQATNEALGCFRKENGAYEGDQAGIGLKSWSYCVGVSNQWFPAITEERVMTPAVSVVTMLQSNENWTPDLPTNLELPEIFRKFVEQAQNNNRPEDGNTTKDLGPITCRLTLDDGYTVIVELYAKYNLFGDGDQPTL